MDAVASDLNMLETLLNQKAVIRERVRELFPSQLSGRGHSSTFKSRGVGRQYLDLKILKMEVPVKLTPQRGGDRAACVNDSSLASSPGTLQIGDIEDCGQRRDREQ